MKKRQKEETLKRVIAFILVLLLLSLSVSCGSLSKDPHVSKWFAHSVEVWGYVLDASNIWEEGLVIDLQKQGKSLFQVGEQEIEGQWIWKDDVLIVQIGEEEISGTIEEDQMILDNVRGSGAQITFYKEGVTPEPLEAPSTMDYGFLLELFDMGTPMEMTVAGEWYGVAYHQNASDAFPLPVEMDIWAYLGEDSKGANYFEIYSSSDHHPESVLVSMWVQDNGESFLPLIGAEDAWIYDVFLLPSEAAELQTPLNVNGTMTIEYAYEDDDGNYADIIFYLVREGMKWAGPAHERGNEPDIDESPKQEGGEDLQAEAWVHTTEDTLWMHLPEGWEIDDDSPPTETSFHAHSGGSEQDRVAFWIEPYSDLLEEYEWEWTPENQMLLETDEEDIYVMDMGSAEVWYRIFVYDNETLLQGYTAFDEEHYVSIEVTVHASNGTIEEFLTSDPWQSISESVRIQP